MEIRYFADIDTLYVDLSDRLQVALISAVESPFLTKSRSRLTLGDRKVVSN